MTARNTLPASGPHPAIIFRFRSPTTSNCPCDRRLRRPATVPYKPADASSSARGADGLELKSGLVTDIAPRQRRARNGQLPTSRRRAANIRIGDFAAALNKTLRQRSERAILDPDESDRRRRRQNFDWQNLDVHLLTAKTHDR